MFSRYHVLMLIVAALLPLSMSSRAQAQNQSGRITGTVVDDTGAPLAGVYVTYSRFPFSLNDSTPGSGGTTTDGQGAYSFANLVAGAYSLCAYLPPARGLVMDCEWAVQPHTVTLQPDQKEASATITMHKGCVLRIFVADPTSALRVTDWVHGPTNLITGVWTSDGLFHRASMRSGGNGPMEFVIVAPLQEPLTVYAAGAGLDIRDSAGKAVNSAGMAGTAQLAKDEGQRVINLTIAGPSKQ